MDEEHITIERARARERERRVPSEKGDNIPNYRNCLSALSLNISHMLHSHITQY